MASIKAEKRLCKLTAGILAATLCISVIPKINGTDKVSAAEQKNHGNTGLGTSQIGSPVAPESIDSAWTGSYVYFGSYNENPIKFRVLDPNTTRFGGNTMLLDSDKSLFTKRYNEDPEDYWVDCTLRTYLNDSFLNGSFTSGEIEAIAESSCETPEYEENSFIEFRFDPNGLFEDKIFVLDAADVTNPEYGYHEDCGVTINGTDWSKGGLKFHAVQNHSKENISGKESYISYRLRCGCTLKQDGYAFAGAIDDEGFVVLYDVQANDALVSPALNIDQDAVIFSTAVSGSYGSTGTEYKLTLAYDGFGIKPSSKIPSSGNEITIPYEITGTDNASRVSVLILDKEYKAGNSNNASILYYDELNGTFGDESSGSFTLPSSLNINDWGTDYYVYVLAEDINGSYESDYASAPVMVSKPIISGWHRNNTGWWYINEDGSYPVSKWQFIDGNWYYFNEPGYMVTGWQQIGGNWYYFSSSGAMCYGWQYLDNYYYYLGNKDDGAMKTGWQYLNDHWYYLDSNGKMAIGWKKINERWYFFSSAGEMVTGWLKIENTWYYLDTSGAMVESTWKKVDGFWYFFDKSGAMITGWKYINGFWYYFYNNGQMASDAYIGDDYVDAGGVWVDKNDN